MILDKASRKQRINKYMQFQTTSRISVSTKSGFETVISILNGTLHVSPCIGQILIPMLDFFSCFDRPRAGYHVDEALLFLNLVPFLLQHA